MLSTFNTNDQKTRLNTIPQTQYQATSPSSMPPKTALLVIDAQSFFSSMLTTALPNIITLLKSFSTQISPLPIIFTQHGHSDSELEDEETRNQLIRKWGVGGSIRVESEDAEIVEELREYLPNDGEKGKGEDEVSFPLIIPKNTYDAFLPPDALSSKHYPPTPPDRQLSHILTEAQVERVVVCGVMTDCCVDTTARGTFNRGYETWVVSDACASANKRQHEAALRCHEFGFGDIITTKEVVRRLRDEGFLR